VTIYPIEERENTFLEEREIIQLKILTYYKLCYVEKTAISLGEKGQQPNHQNDIFLIKLYNKD